MNLEQFPRLRDALESGYEFNIGQFFQQGFDLMKKNLGGFIGYTLLYMAILMVLGIIPFIGNIASIVLSPPLAAGWFIVANKLQKNAPTEFGDFFKGFDYIGQLILVYIISILIYVAIMSPALIAGGAFMFAAISDVSSMDSAFPTWLVFIMLAIMIPLAYLAVAWRWAPMFVVFHKMGFWDAMETSRKIVTKRWFSHFAMMLLVSLFFTVAALVLIGGMVSTGATGIEALSSTVVLVGALLFLGGALLITPFYQCVEYAAFASVTQINASDSVDDIVDHLVD
ncbi:MAG: hypothetical protein IPJ74_21665 [Saprospiraceae bacterium]|nr:hypothetical protein [Saprospiraceae bacterium]